MESPIKYHALATPADAPRGSEDGSLRQRSLSRHGSSTGMLPPISVVTRESLPSKPSMGGRRESRMSRASRSGRSGKEDALGKLKINMGKERTVGANNRFRPDFKFNMELALRTAVGVIIASMVQTAYNPSTQASTGYVPTPTQVNGSIITVPEKLHKKQWFFFPEWYILGGLTYVATATIFSCGKNIGSTVREIYQQICGVGVAFLYNYAIFSVFQPELFASLAEANKAVNDNRMTWITKSFSGTPYYVHQGDFYTILPFIMVFTFVMLMIPVENNTRKFAIGNNLYFALTLVSPNDFIDPSKLKGFNDPYYTSENILKNLAVYMLLGVLGACIALFVLWVPYPIFAIRRLQKETLSAADTVQDLLNLIVDSYCFKNKDVEHMNFLKLKLKRKFDMAMAKRDAMTALLNDVWWEQSVGLHYFLTFRTSVTKPYMELYASLIDNLRAMTQAIQLERYERLHMSFMKKLQKDVYMIQLKATTVLNEISKEIHLNNRKLDLSELQELERQMEKLLQDFQKTQTKIYHKENPTTTDVEGNIPLNLFLFSLQSFCTTLVEFQDAYNNKDHKTRSRMKKFFKNTVLAYFDSSKYTKLKFQNAFKIWFAILAGCFFSVYVFGYSSTTASTVAYVMGNRIGGSFSVTVNRVGGVVAGSIIPSVFLFFICSYGCASHAVVVFFTNAILFVWVTFSMYIKWKGGYEAYAGLVAAYVAAGVLLKGCACESKTITPISSYSNLCQMSLGIILFIFVELVFCPQSAIGLLRENVQKQMKLAQEAFTTLFEQNLSSEGAVDKEKMDDVKSIVTKKVPALLTEQVSLLREASFEPLLWKPAFSYQKYEAVLDCCQRLLNNTLILYKLVSWFQFRKEQKLADGVALEKKLKLDEIIRASVHTEHVVTTKEAWAFSTKELGAAIHDTFDTLHALFGEDFRYADADQTALFMQMKEAFRLADTDCSGEIDADEVKTMLQHIFAQSGAMKVEAIDDYVADFMNIVDADRSGKVSFEEFMEALENGLKLEVEVFQHKSRPLALAAITETDEVTVNVHALEHQQSSPAKMSPMTRSHDMLNVDSFSLLDIAKTMRASYAEWLMEKKRYEKVSMEELLLLNCLISGVSGIARNLALLEEMTVQQ
ncbi:transmembrane protein [Achlya hypogyna]|uniref:Transmembrane protein n=1 Tax=Achlya hypogyna TaxID=1202772 RepID=A0A1V9YG86_ACHHY|nr:transmembrane protein [Achlya hypogyna]